MLRRLLTAIGFLLLTAPRGVVETVEPLAFENPDDARLRGWTLPMARLEGLVSVLLARRESDGAGLTPVLGLLGAPMVVAPRRYLDWGLSVAYENPADIRVKSWVLPVTRAIGVVYVLAALKSLRKSRTE